MGWSVTVTDMDPEALERMRTQIYPGRYGTWDDAIELLQADQCKPYVGEFDIIMIGTPPDSHGSLAESVLPLKPRLLHVEKPLLAAPDDIARFEAAVAGAPDTIVTVGYDHAVAPVVKQAVDRVHKKVIGRVQSIDVKIYASFDDIFAAHPWLKSIQESYLSNWTRGGGALQEHSHGLHLGLLFAEIAGCTPLEVVSSALDMEANGEGADFDRLAHMVLCGGGVFVHVVEDVFTRPTRKEVEVRGSNGTLLLSLGATEDTVTIYDASDACMEQVAQVKTRPDDFYALVLHYNDLLNNPKQIVRSPVRVGMGIEVMRFIQKAFAL